MDKSKNVIQFFAQPGSYQEGFEKGCEQGRDVVAALYQVDIKRYEKEVDRLERKIAKLKEELKSKPVVVAEKERPTPIPPRIPSSPTHGVYPYVEPAIARGAALGSRWDQHDTFSVEEAAEILRLSRDAAYAAVRKNIIGSIRIGRRLLIPRAVLEKILTGD